MQEAKYVFLYQISFFNNYPIFREKSFENDYFLNKNSWSGPDSWRNYELYKT